jgi:hypothetical protein
VNRGLAANLAACLLLLIQYLIGVVVNVYIVLPVRHPGANAASYVSGSAAGLGCYLAGAVLAVVAARRPG